MKYDYIVVGSGLFGAVFAQQVKESGKNVLVVEKRDHIGGNCHSYKYEDTEIDIHTYGTHIFHTNDEKTWKYINRFTEFNRYQHRVLTTHQNQVYSMPINLGTINRFYGVNLKPNEVEAFLNGKKGDISNPKNLEEKAISLIGRDLYEVFIKGYTTKQWGCDPTELPASIINRLPVRNSYHDAYFNDKYQGIPIDGYTPIFERLLEGIPVELNTDFFEDRSYWLEHCHKLVYTGPIDRYFDYTFGRLTWRSVRFEVEHHPVDDYQGTSVMNYADVEIPYTRIHEPKHLHPERKMKRDETVIIREYSQINNDAPYYPVNSQSDKSLLAQYQSLQSEEKNVIFGGRLAQYKYFDMHHVIASAIAAASKEFKEPDMRLPATQAVESATNLKELVAVPG